MSGAIVLFELKVAESTCAHLCCESSSRQACYEVRAMAAMAAKSEEVCAALLVSFIYLSQVVLTCAARSPGGFFINAFYMKNGHSGAFLVPSTRHMWQAQSQDFPSSDRAAIIW